MIDFSHQQIAGIPAALALFHVQRRKAPRLSKNNLEHRHRMFQDCQGRTGISQGCYGRELAISTPVPHLCQAAGVLGMVSMTPCLGHARVPGMGKGHLTAQLTTLMLRPSETSRVHRSSQ